MFLCTIVLSLYEGLSFLRKVQNAIRSIEDVRSLTINKLASALWKAGENGEAYMYLNCLIMGQFAIL